MPPKYLRVCLLPRKVDKPAHTEKRSEGSPAGRRRTGHHFMPPGQLSIAPLAPRGGRVQIPAGWGTGPGPGSLTCTLHPGSWAW